jgi:hypothetical protein
MATKKTEKKPTTHTTKKSAVVTDDIKKSEMEKKSPLKVKTPDGTEVELKDGDIVKANDDGTFEFGNSESLLKANAVIISIGMKDNDGNVQSMSYPVRIKKCDNGNIVFALSTADGMDSVKKKMDCAKPINENDGVCLIGRGQNLEAMFAAQTCWDGYARNFGIANSYSLVRLELDKASKQWLALFAPVINVMG